MNQKILNVINILLNVYFSMMIVYIFATWIPKIDWKSGPWKFLKITTEVYLNIFEKIIPGWGCVIGVIVFRLLQNYFLKLYR